MTIGTVFKQLYARIRCKLGWHVESERYPGTCDHCPWVKEKTK